MSGQIVIHSLGLLTQVHPSSRVHSVQPSLGIKLLSSHSSEGYIIPSGHSFTHISFSTLYPYSH